MKVLSGAFLLLAFLQLSCEKSVSFELDNVAPKLVVEATIENGQAPIVYLSRSLAYFSTLNPVSQFYPECRSLGCQQYPYTQTPLVYSSIRGWL